MAQVNYPNQMIQELTKLILEHGNTEVGQRLQGLMGKSKSEIVNGLEQIVKDIKTKDLKADSATSQTIKHVYRKITS